MRLHLSQLPLMALALLMCSPTAHAQIRAQEQRAINAPRAVQRDAGPQIKVFHLQYADAGEAAQVVGQLMDNLRASADIRTNSLVASGTEAELKALEAILLRLDETPDNKVEAGKLVKVFRLQSDPRRIEKALKLIVDRDTRFSLDEYSNSVIVHGTKEQLEKVSQLIKVIDTPPPAAAPQAPLKLRVIWLMSGERPGAKPLTDDLKPVAVSLAKIGIDDLSIVTQTLINVTEPNSDFSVRGTVGEEEWMFQISGTRQGETSTPARIDLSIEAAARKKSPIEVEAAVTLAPRQMAVLGVTQTGPANSVFVVQLVEGL